MMSTAFIRRNGLVLALVAVLLVAIMVMGLRWNGQQNELSVQQQTISELETDLQRRQLEQRAGVDEDVFAALGVTSTRLEDDSVVMASLLTTMFTWDSGESYEQARQKLVSRYGLNTEGPFLTGFMPPSSYNTDEEGKRYYYLDSVGLNSSFDGSSMTMEVLSVKGTDYRYAVLANMTMTSDIRKVKDNSGNQLPTPRVTRKVLLYVTVDAEGQVSDLDGVPASGTTRTSG